MKSNKGLIILVCTILFGSSIIATKVSTAINMNSIDLKENNYSEVLGLNEAANYLHLSEEQVITMINIEKIDLEEDGIFLGMMLPYFTVDGQYYFSKAELDNWLKEVANEHIEYDTAEGWRR